MGFKQKVSFRMLSGISVHFSDIHRNYFSAWKYVTKQDNEFVESPGNLDLSDGLPKTTKASFANKPHSTGSQGAESVPHDYKLQ